MSNGDRHWYEMGWERATGNSTAERTFRSGRVYIIRCRKCEHEHRFAPNSASDEQLRKSIERDGWELGRKPNQHLCPDCNVLRPRPPESPVVPVNGTPALPETPSAVPFLIEAWDDATPEERDQLLTKIGVSSLSVPIPEPLPPPEPPTLLQRWNDATEQERIDLIMPMWSHWWDNVPMDVVEKLLTKYNRKASLIEHWGCASDDERHKFRAFLQNAFQVAEPPKPIDLVEVYNKATRAQRNELIDLIDGWRRKERGWYIGPAPRSEAPELVPVFVDGLTKPKIGKNASIPEGAIRKTDFAKLVGCDRSTVSGYILKGMPERDDGLLDRAAALAWYQENKNKQRKTPTRTHTVAIDTAAPAPDGKFTLQLNDDAAIKELSHRLLGPPEAA